jgi:hypothetical protein
MAYMDEYRKGMSRDYRQKINYALDRTRQRESLTGRRSSPQERAAIVAGVLRPQAQAYSQDYMRGLELQESSRQWEQQYDLRRKALKQQKEADEIGGITEFAKLGLGAGMLYQDIQADRAHQEWMRKFQLMWGI